MRLFINLSTLVVRHTLLQSLIPYNNYIHAYEVYTIGGVGTPFNVQDRNLILITTIKKKKKINSSFVIKYILLRIGTPVKVAGLNQSTDNFRGKTLLINYK